MKIDLTPLYASTVGFDRFGSLLDAAMKSERQAPGYPPYDIELVDEDLYVDLTHVGNPGRALVTDALVPALRSPDGSTP